MLQTTFPSHQALPIAICASTGVAATLLPDCTTVHHQFGLDYMAGVKSQNLLEEGDDVDNEEEGGMVGGGIIIIC